MCGVSMKDRFTNSDVRERCGLKDDEVARVEKSVIGFVGGGGTSWSTRPHNENGPDRIMRYHTLTEYRLDVTAFAFECRPTSESSGGPLPLHQILFLPERMAMHR
ncbi:hypothetical protein EVAR_22271_1 [Eumeta japonica]|uniref:Uncharacterized protein n=1 Tax=Eumeta variegata TaxID=151549 RepID=A0A4C1UBU6_EUMVA|nr:hypothetical protein EVAR_22271_1 [Eumeta japonica]